MPSIVAPFPLLVWTSVLQEGVTDDPVLLAAEWAQLVPFCDVFAGHTRLARNVEIASTLRTVLVA